ncbi:MAG TPA: hypothetical protein PKK55_05305 [Methanofastidiosum sp.]|nr:hypothetical protein [Methanofastidiosum sp.]
MGEVLKLKKETDNKIRWDKVIDNTPFELYIPKWRVPSPTPRDVEIEVLPHNNSILNNPLTITQAKNNPNLKNSPINANLTKFSDHSRTVRFDPEGNENMWEIGSVYIPISILNQKGLYGKERISIMIKWR